jgi:hypothetical protein
MDTACTKTGDFIFEYLREFEAEFKKVLTRESNAQWELIDEKKLRLKIS